MAALAIVCRAAVLSLAIAGAGARAAEAELHASVKPVCLNPEARRLIEPFAALKSAGAQRRAEPLSAKLCHIGDEFIYEITLLHRDGRLVHVQMEAATGKLVPRAPREPRESREPREPHEPPVK